MRGAKGSSTQRRLLRRGLALFPGVGVVSASHDMTLRLWGLGGEVRLGQTLCMWS